MAFRATSRHLRSMVNQLGANRTIATSTVPKMKPFQQVANPHHADHHQHFRSWVMKGEFFPVYVVLGMILVSTSLGLVTARQELRYNPSVRVNKKRREKLEEVEEPERVVKEAEQFIRKSLFRKVAHVQNYADREPVIIDPIRADVFAAGAPKAVTLNSVGVDSSKY